MRIPTLVKHLSGQDSASDDQSQYWSLARSLDSAIISSLDLGTVLGAAANELGNALNASRCIVALLRDGELQIATYSSEHRADAESSWQSHLPSSGKYLSSVDLARALPASASLIEMADPTKDPSEAAEWVRNIIEYTRGTSGKYVLVTPLVLNSQTIGALLVFQSNRRRKWSLHEKQLVKAVASSLVLAISKIRYYEKAKSAVDRETLTNRLLTAIRTAYSVDDTLKVLVEGVGPALGVSRAALYMRADDYMSESADETMGSMITARAEYRPSDSVPSVLGSRLDIEESPLLGRVLAGEIVTVADTSESHPIVRAVGVRLGIRALLLAPITANGHTAAVLTLEQCDGPREFSEEEIGLVRLVTEQTAVALHQARLYRDAQEAARREGLISKIGSAIHVSLDRDTVLQTIVKELGAALSVCRCGLALLPDPMPEHLPITHEYVASCCKGRRPIVSSIPVLDNLHLQSVLSTHRPLAADDVTTDPRFAVHLHRTTAAGVKSIMAASIWLGGRPIGILTLEHRERRHCWTKWEIDIVQSVAEQAAVAIRQAEFYREARESATRAALVNQIVASIRRSLDLEETLQVAVEELGCALGASRINFRKLMGDKMVVVAEFLSDPGLSVKHLPMAASDNLIRSMLETRRTLIIDDVAALTTSSPHSLAATQGWQAEPSSLSQIVCPIVINEKFWGVLSISQTDNAREWSTSELALVEAVTAQVEVAVSHSHLFEEAKRAARREALISHIIHGINQSNRLDEIFPIVARALGDHLAADRFLIVRPNQESQVWVVECEYGDGVITAPGVTYRFEEFENLVTMIKNGPLLCADVHSDDRITPFLERFLEPMRSRAFMAVPVMYNAAPRLVIAAIMRSKPREWSLEEAEIVRAAADQVLIAIQRAELFEEISHGKHEWEATFDALTDGVLIFDRRGILRRVNQAGAAIEGAQVSEMIGRRCCTLLQGVEGDTCRVGPVIETGRPVTFELMPERLARPLLVTISPLANGDGTLGAVCIVRDLSELRAAEAAAREQHNFLAKLIEHANDAIFALSAEGRFVWFNEQLCRLSGYSREELLASDYRQFLPSGEEAVVVGRFARAWRGDAQTFEMRGLNKNGEVRLLLITYTPIYDEGRISSILSIARDVTEERLAAERAAQADKLRALGQLASGVAHNFNNVLAAILGNAQLIKRGLKDENMVQRIDIIERAALDGAQTVKRIQGFALQQNETALEVVDINQLVHDSTNLTRARWCDDAQSRGLTYDVELKLESVPLALGVPSELREVFVNLILNALDAMPDGGRLLISSKAAEPNIRISFTDDGIGMSRQVLERVFEPFFTTKSTTGMGLGLAVSYGIIDRHGGRIEARSDPGLGSTFTVTLPAANSVPRKVAPSVTAKVGSARILVVDDDERVCEALAGMLTSAGHTAVRAASGPEGLAKMEQAQFDVVITDLSMPEKDGWAVASEIRQRWPHTKIVLATGFALSPESLEHHRDLVDAVILKPIRIDDITTAFSRVFS